MGDLDLARFLMILAGADLLLLGLCLLTGLLLRWVVRRGAPSSNRFGHPWWRQFALGAIVAVVALALTVVPAAVARGYSPGPGWQAFTDENVVVIGLFGTWLLFALQSLLEELVFRGVAMPLLAGGLFALVYWFLRRSGKDRSTDAPQRAWLWIGLLVNIGLAVVFGLVHADNPNATPIAIFNVMLASLVLGQLMWNQASILGAWAFHWIWNAAVVTLGLPISGVRLPPPVAGFGASGARDGLLTGGQFGPEGSLPCTLALAAGWAWLVATAIRDVRRPAPFPTEETGDLPTAANL